MSVGRRYFLLTVAVSLLVSSVPPPVVVAGDVFRLLVLHTNDMHSRFDQIDQTGGPCNAATTSCFGGFARLRTAVRDARARAAAAAQTPSLFLNAGDTFQGSAFYTYLKWKAVSRMVRTLDIDVMSLGNHEFDDGVKDLQMFLHSINIPVVACNLDLSNEPLLANETNLVKSKTLTVNGRQIGIIGYLTPDTMFTSIVGQVKILPEIPSIAAEAKRLKNEGVNIILALGHSGFEVDCEIAKQVEDIDLVIGGHSNTFLFNGVPQDHVKPTGNYPFLVQQPKTRRTVPVVQASYLTKYLGELWLEFDKAGEVIKSHGNPILLDSSIKQDPDVVKEVKELENMLDVQTTKVIGSTSVFLEGIDEYCRVRECNTGNMITDFFIDYNIRTNLKSFDLTKYWTDAPIAIIQSGGIRANINHMAENGDITLGSLLSSLPFRTDMGKVTVKGSDIWSAFEYSVRRYSQIQFRGEFLQVSGLKVVFDLSKPIFKRVQSIEARCGNCVVPVYQKLDLNANYTIIISTYLANGGDGFEFNKANNYRSFEITESDIVAEELQLKSPVHPGITQRIILLNADVPDKANSQQISAPLSKFSLLLVVMIGLMYGQ